MDQRQEEERLGEYWFSRSRYYDTPDYEDLLLKLGVTSKYAFALGLTAGAINAAGSQPYAVGHLERTFRLGKVLVPVMGMSVAFNVTSYVVAKARMKDDPYNHTLGGVAAGAVLGLTNGSFKGGLVCSLALGLMGFMKKATVLYYKDKKVKPFQRRVSSSYWERTLDWSLLSDKRKRNWSRDPPPE